MTRPRMIELAIRAFTFGVHDYTDGELYDMLCGNISSYSAMPDLSQWLDPVEHDEVNDNGKGTD